MQPINSILNLESPTDLKRFLIIPLSSLEEIINTPVYQHYIVKKKKGGERHIFAPDKKLKEVQKWLKEKNRFQYVLITAVLCPS